MALIFCNFKISRTEILSEDVDRIHLAKDRAQYVESSEDGLYCVKDSEFYD